MTENDKHFAVLIDADNISDKYVKSIFDELSTDGTATYKRIYGDWTSSNMSHWKDTLLEYSITPIQQYAYTTGKNATDSAMIIDAMDILYSSDLYGFCIVSSDSDFTRLASRLRESGKCVIGMGEAKTPSAFVKACDRFKYLDLLAKSGNENSSLITPIENIKSTLASIIRDISDEDGWSPLSNVGNILSKRFPDFDVRNYGYTKLTHFIDSLKDFNFKTLTTSNTNVKVVYIKNK